MQEITESAVGIESSIHSSRAFNTDLAIDEDPQQLPLLVCFHAGDK